LELLQSVTVLNLNVLQVIVELFEHLTSLCALVFGHY